MSEWLTSGSVGGLDGKPPALPGTEKRGTTEYTEHTERKPDEKTGLDNLT